MTKIEWCDKTWNPVVGCSPVSPGCTNCYAMGMAARLERMGNAPQYDSTTSPSRAGPVFNGKVALAKNALLEPLKRQTPTIWFVNSMGDLFHDNVPDNWIDRVFAIMALCPQHTFKILTKRSGRMREYVLGLHCDGARRFVVADTAEPIATAHKFWVGDGPTDWDLAVAEAIQASRWPLPNVHLGVSAEDQDRWNERTVDLGQTPAAVRFVSAEPLLGPIDRHAPYAGVKVDMLRGGHPHIPPIDQVIVGGESGRNARAMHPLWPQDLRDQCLAAGTAFFFKQWGEWLPVAQGDLDEYGGWISGGRKPKMERVRGTDKCGYYCSDEHGCVDHREAIMKRVGKKVAGRLLDGREWNEVPL